MYKIRIYFSPKGYIDVICDYVNVFKDSVEVVGGSKDGTVYKNTRGAKFIKKMI